MPKSVTSRIRSARGFTLLEALMVVLILGIMAAIVAPTFRGMSNDLENGTRESAGFLRLARAQAMTTTSAYRIRVVSDAELQGEHARQCDDVDWTPDPRVRLELREGVRLQGADIQPNAVLLCYSSRGVANASPTLTVADRDGRTASVEVFLGGTLSVVLPGQGG